MPRVTGCVDKLVPKVSPTGKPWFSVTLNGQLYSYWGSLNFKHGDTIEFDEIAKGKYKNIAEPKVVATATTGGITDTQPPEGKTVQTSRPDGSWDNDVEARIVRQNATSTAAAIVGASKIAGKADADTLLAMVKEISRKLFDMNMYGYDPREDPMALAAPSKEVEKLFDA